MQFAKGHHQPLHVSNDIFDRDFDAGTFRCVACGADHQFPPKMDIYVCCFPCGPWSLQGARLGFNDRDGAIVWQAAKTINVLMPGVWYMENVMGLSSSKTGMASASDLKVVTDSLAEQMPHYHIMCLQQLNPTQMGFPIHRSRIVITGARKEFTKPDVMVRNFQTLVNNPLTTCADWRAFLGRGQPKYDMSLIGAPRDASSGGVDGCSCSVDPYQACALHPCQCWKCARTQVVNCEWRKTHTRYIQKHIGDNDVAAWVANTSKLMSYLQGG